MIYGIEQRKGFVAIAGEVGVGKTTILRYYLETVKQLGLKTIYIINPALTFRELLRMIYYELDVPCESDEVSAMVDRLHHLLIEGYRQYHSFVLLIDEAHNLPVETLKNLGMLPSVETSKDSLIQIVLVGQPELSRLLDLPELKQLKQRISIRADIPPLSPWESLEYIKYRLKKAGGDIDRIFTRRAIDMIIKESNGIPRLMNIICDNALITGFGYDKKPVGRKIVQEVVADLMNRQKPRYFWKWGVVLSLVAVLVPLYFGVRYVKTLIGSNRVEVGQQIATPIVLNGTSGNESLSPVNPSNANRRSQLPRVAPSGDPQPNTVDPVGVSSQGRSEERVSHQTSDNRETRPAVSMNDDSNPVVAPPETAPPATLKALSPSTSESPNLVAEPIQSTTDSGTKSVRKTVKKGDTLSELATEVYGYSGSEIITILQDHNPHIKDPDRIMVGDEILFPVLDGTKHAQ